MALLQESYAKVDTIPGEVAFVYSSHVSSILVSRKVCSELTLPVYICLYFAEIELVQAANTTRNSGG